MNSAQKLFDLFEVAKSEQKPRNGRVKNILTTVTLCQSIAIHSHNGWRFGSARISYNYTEQPNHNGSTIIGFGWNFEHYVGTWVSV